MYRCFVHGRQVAIKVIEAAAADAAKREIMAVSVPTNAPKPAQRAAAVFIYATFDAALLVRYHHICGLHCASKLPRCVPMEKLLAVCA